MATLVASLVLAVLLEAGTLVGAPVASPLVLSDWRPKRMMVFFVLSVLLVTWLTSIGAGRALRRWADGLREDGHAGVKRLARGILVLCAATVLGWLACALVTRLLGASWDYRYGMVVSCLAFCVAALVLLRGTLAEKPEWGFLAVSLAFGTLLCVLMPAYSAISFDGFIHFDDSLAMSYVCDAEYTGADVVMSSENAGQWADFTNSKSKSIFNVIFMPSFVINLFLLFFIRPLLTKLAVLWVSCDIKSFLSIMGKLMLAVVGISVVVLAGAYLLGIPILQLVFGVDLEGYLPSLLIVLVGGGLLSAANVLYNGIVIMRRQRLVLIAYGIAVLVGVLIAQPLVVSLGILGASIAYAISCGALLLTYVALFAWSMADVRKSSMRR